MCARASACACGCGCGAADSAFIVAASRIASTRCVVHIGDDGVGISHVRLDGYCVVFVADVSIVLDDVHVSKESDVYIYIYIELDDGYEGTESDVDIEPIDKVNIEPIVNVDLFFDFLLLGFCTLTVATSPNVIPILGDNPSLSMPSLRAPNMLCVDTGGRERPIASDDIWRSP